MKKRMLSLLVTLAMLMPTVLIPVSASNGMISSMEISDLIIY